MIAIIDYNMGNLRSVFTAMKRLRLDAVVASDKQTIAQAEKLILPGVGHFSKGMKNIKDLGLFDMLQEEVVIKKKPILGICLGMQLFTSFSQEGDCEGFGWIDAQTRKFNFNQNKYRSPHMGWNTLQVKKDCQLLKNFDSKSDLFYFVHSYFVECKNQEDIIANTGYEVIFTSFFNRDNIWGVQFHPEKSHDAGLELLKNFAET